MIDEILDELQLKLEESLGALKTDLGKLRTGRASISILDGIRVNYYGTPTPLAQCAGLSVPDARMIMVKPWERNILGDIEKAILTSDVGIMPQNDGEVIRLPIPELTEERRKDLVKQAKQRGEAARVAMRSHRRDANELLKAAEKEKEISEDDLKRAMTDVQKHLDKSTNDVDQLLAKKEKEILGDA